MPQYDFNDPSPLPGTLAQCGGPAPEIISVANPLLAQIGDIDVNGATTDGTYTLAALGTDGSGFSVSFVAASKTAAEIAAGLAAAINNGIVSRGLAFAEVHDTDQFSIAHTAGGVTYAYTLGGPAGPVVLANIQDAGYSVVPVGVILQADGSGGFSLTYSDAALALGIVMRSANLLLPSDPNQGVGGYDGPCFMDVLAIGNAHVRVAGGVTVMRGQKVYFNSTTRTWSNVTTNSHVLVEGAQWQTSGAGVQAVRVRLPSET